MSKANAKTMNANPSPRKGGGEVGAATLSPLEKRARRMALAGMRALRAVAWKAGNEDYPTGEEDDSPEQKALLSAGKWGEALRAVCRVLWNLDGGIGGAMITDAGMRDAEKAVSALEEAEEKAKRKPSMARKGGANVRGRFLFAQNVFPPWKGPDKAPRKGAAKRKPAEAASKPAKAPTPQGKANTAPASGKPSKGQQKGKPRA